MKYLGIDFGSKKCGLAVSDDRGTVAVPLKIVPTEDLEKEVDYILSNVLFERIVFGESVNSKGEHNAVWELTKKFADSLKEKYEARFLNGEIEIKFEKEFLSSKHARYLDNEKDVDDRAAALILQRFLDKENQKNKTNQDVEEEDIYDNEDL
jgi:putative Holliday junction resolvase